MIVLVSIFFPACQLSEPGLPESHHDFRSAGMQGCVAPRLHASTACRGAVGAVVLPGARARRQGVTA